MKNTNTNKINNEINEAPVWFNDLHLALPKGLKLTKTQHTKYWRLRSAWNLAALKKMQGKNISIDDIAYVEHCEFKAAERLLNSIIKYALADAREWELENTSEWYCNSEEHCKKEKQLEARRAKLDKALEAYGCKLLNYGLYPRIVNIEDDSIEYNLLYYYD